MSFFINYIHTTAKSPCPDARVIRNGTIINKNDVIGIGVCCDVNSDPSYGRIWTFSSVISNMTVVGKGTYCTYANSFCPICSCGGQTINIVIRYGAFVDK